MKKKISTVMTKMLSLTRKIRTNNLNNSKRTLSALSLTVAKRITS
jgi:hypothetical protein